MLIHSIKLDRFLSYGPASEAVPLQALNVIIGPNGSGKSNLLEAVELIRGAPKDLLTPIREGGGLHDWLWKGEDVMPTAAIEVVVANPKGPDGLRYVLSFTEVSQRFELVDERIENEHPDSAPRKCMAATLLRSPAEPNRLGAGSAGRVRNGCCAIVLARPYALERLEVIDEDRLRYPLALPEPEIEFDQRVQWRQCGDREVIMWNIATILAGMGAVFAMLRFLGTD